MTAKKIELELTKYERARLIGARALQLALGAPPLLEVSKIAKKDAYVSPIELAVAELDAGIIPLQVIK